MSDSDLTEVVRAYHRASKHHLDRYAPGPGRLDWANQPDPFRVFAGCARIALPLIADRLDVRYADLREGRLPAPAPFDLERLGALFEISLGLAAWKEYQGSRWALRCNPSSGNLHPTEGYLVAPQLPGLAAGVYHYVSRDHVLERRATWPADAQPPSAVLLGLTSIPWREAWKYGLRAFRYCQLDIGHAIAALSFAAAALGWRVRLEETIGEAELATLLGLDRPEDFGAAEAELPECLLVLETDGEALPDLPPASGWIGRANRLSAEHREWPGLDEVAEATAKPAAEEESRHASPEAFASDDADRWGAIVRAAASITELPAARLYRQRRSAQAFDGVTGMAAAAFLALLARLLPDLASPPWSAWPHAPRLHPVLFVHRVDGLEPGLYLLVREDADLAGLKSAMRPEWLWEKRGPVDLPLYLLLPHDLREVAAQLSCHQAIAADACFAVSMLADFSDLDEAPWAYRRRYWEAGLLGQVLYLEAEAIGLRGTGIGCYFDDAAHRLLGLDPDGRWQAVYHFTVGGALEDARLTTLAPYGGRD